MEAIAKPTVHMVDVVGQYRRYQEEIDQAILSVVRSGAYINGPETKTFEREMQEYLDLRHAIGCASGTDALQLALMAVGIEPGDEVITTPFTFVATTETIALLGAKPVYVDIDPNTFNIDPEQIEAKITSHTRVILPVHLFGQPANMTRINEIARKHGLFVIEDAAQAVGATWEGNKVCGIGAIGCISFYPSKNLGAFGDGGMITTNSDDLGAKLRSIANHGSSRTYYHDHLGVASRLDSIQAAVLRVKLKYLDEWNARRKEAAGWYNERLKVHADKLQLPTVDPRATMIWHQYTVVLSGDRDAVSQKLKDQGVPHNVYYPVPLHLQSAYRSYGGNRGELPNAEYAADHVLSLPMHSELTEEQVDYICDKLIEAL